MTKHVGQSGGMLAAFAVVVCVLGDAHAAPIDGVVVQGQMGKVLAAGDMVPIAAGATTMIHVLGGISKAESNTVKGVKIVPLTHALLVQTKPDAMPGTRVKAIVTGPTLPNGVPLRMEVVSTVPDQQRQYYVISRGELEAYEQDRRLEKDQEVARIRRNERDVLYEATARRRLNAGTRMLAKTVQLRWSSDAVRVMFHTADSFGEHPDQELLIPIELAAAQLASFELKDIEIWDERTQQRLDSRVIYANVPRAGDALMKLSAGERAMLFMAVRLRNAEDAPMLRVVLRRAGGTAVTAQGSDWSQASTDPEEEKQKEEEERKHREWVLRQFAEAKKIEQDRELAERNRELAKRTWIGVHALYGAIWLDDGLPMTENTDPTNLAGFGIRVAKGLIPMSKGPTAMLSFEADVVVARSGTASFPDVVLDGMQGELQRTATLVRVQAGGMLRFGNPFSVVVRAGVGGQGISQGSNLMTGSGPVPGPDLPTEVTLGGYAGVGVDYRLGGKLAVGLEATLSDSGRSLEGRMAFMYRL